MTSFPRRAVPFLVFALVTALYFGTRSPALDEWDSVQFALGATHGFNLFAHQPHPPGYPLYVFAGWLGVRLGLDVLTALELAAAMGGGLFVAAWHALARRATGDARLAALFAATLAILPITWMTATKALSDAPAAGLLALELLAASLYRERRTRGMLVWTALAGAVATGIRPQNIAVVAIILAFALAGGNGGGWRRWVIGFGVFIAGCLVWLLPTMLLQARWPEAEGSVWAYPAQLWHQWTWRLDQPKAFVGATGQTAGALVRRVWLHFGGMFTRGFAFSENVPVGTLGLGLLGAGWFLCWRQRPAGTVALLRGSVGWAMVYVLIIFVCLPPDQRYYLPIFPLLLLPALAGWWDIGRWLLRRAVARGDTFPDAHRRAQSTPPRLDRRGPAVAAPRAGRPAGLGEPHRRRATRASGALVKPPARRPGGTSARLAHPPGHPPPRAVVWARGSAWNGRNIFPFRRLGRKVGKRPRPFTRTIRG